MDNQKAGANQLNYSEDQLDTIARAIVAEDTGKRREGQTFLGKYVTDDWNDDTFVQDLYEQYLSTVQQARTNKHTNQAYGVNSTFEGYLQDCLQTLAWRRTELSKELAYNVIDHRVYNNAKAVADMSEAAIRKYLERSPTARLVGV